MNMGHHGFFGKGNGTCPMNMYDESVQVPFLISHPGHIPQGKSESGMFSHFDIYQTLMDYLQIDEQFDKQMPGVSFAPILRGGDMEGKTHIVMADEYGPVRMIRTERWKYIHRYLDWEGINELYDLEKDPAEADNLYGKPGFEQITETLRKELFDWYERHGDARYDASLIRCDGNGQIERIWPRLEKDTDMFRLQGANR
jgi:arylsulfatase A-like enzyme